MIVLDKDRALIDDTVAIRLKGFSPRQPVTITATQTFYDSSRWQAHATFTSDDLGCVDVSRQAPISGTYDGISPMGLVRSAERLPGEAQPVSVGSIMRPLPIEIEALSRDGRRAPATLERYVAGRGVTRHPIRSEGIVGTLFLPSGAGPHPAVLVVSGGGGGIDEFRGAILASHGYAALALGHFGLEGLPRGLVNIPLEYFENAIGWMRRRGWLTSWRCGDRREVVNWHFCSVLPSPRSRGSSPGFPAASCFGHSVLASLKIRDRERHGRFVTSHCPVSRKTIQVTI